MNYTVKYKKGGSLSPQKAKEILHDGTIRGHKITDRQRRYFGYISNKAEDGAFMNGDLNSLQVEDNQYKHLSPNMIELGGQPHSSGGTDIAYGNQQVEAEKGETITTDDQGALHVLGNLKIPGTNIKFKTAGKKIGKEEEKVVKQQVKATNLINSNNPYDTYSSFAFNSGNLMQKGAKAKQEALDQTRKQLIDLQENMLDTAEAFGQKPDKLFAKWGKKMPDGGTLDPISFYKSYVSSPAFRSKLTGYDQKSKAQQDNIVNSTLNNLNTLKTYILPQDYNKGYGTQDLIGSRVWDDEFTKGLNNNPKTKINIPTGTNLLIDPVQAQKIAGVPVASSLTDPNIEPIYSHEAAHRMRKLGMDDEFKIWANSPKLLKVMDNKDFKDYQIKNGVNPGVIDQYLGQNELKGKTTAGLSMRDAHDLRLSEAYADLNALRYLFYKNKVYDVRNNQPLNNSHLQKADQIPAIKNNLMYQRFIRNYGKKGLIDINNKVAYNDMNQNNDQAKWGKKLEDGGKVKKKTLQTDYQYITDPNATPRIYDPNYLTNQANQPLQIVRPYYTQPTILAPNIDPAVNNNEIPAGNTGAGTSVAVRHNNPGNIKYAPWLKKYGAVPGEASTEGDVFAQFPDLNTGMAAMSNLLFKGKNYKNLTVQQAASRWTGGHPYSTIPASLANKKLSDLNEGERIVALNAFTKGEDSKLYNWSGITPNAPQTPNADTPWAPIDLQPLPTRQANLFVEPNVGLQNIPTSVPGYQQPNAPDVPTDTYIVNQPKGRKNRFPYSQIAPELYTLATERPDFVPTQRYNPELYQPYQVSFQDQINQNQADFNALSSQLTNNPEALSSLAAKKYEANSSILGNEFRTNQAITNDVNNKNVSLLNDAQVRNLELNDQQFLRQEQARVNTRANIREALNSISSKYQQNRLENQQANILQNLYPNYTFDEQGNRVFIPPTYSPFDYMGLTPQANQYQRTRTTTDKNGNIKNVVTTTPSQADQEKLYNYNQKQKLDLQKRKGLGF